MKFAFATLLLATAGASTITFPDELDGNHCNTHADCPKFFNEPMVCAKVKESMTKARTTPAQEVLSMKYQECTLHAFCATKGQAPSKARLGRDFNWNWDVQCMPKAPPMPTTTLVTADHVKTFGDMQQIKGQMKRHQMSQKLMQ